MHIAILLLLLASTLSAVPTITAGYPRMTVAPTFSKWAAAGSGRSATFTVAASCTGACSYRWYQPSVAEAGTKLRLSGASTATVTVDLFQVGKYKLWVDVTDGSGTVTGKVENSSEQGFGAVAQDTRHVVYTPGPNAAGVELILGGPQLAFGYSGTAVTGADWLDQVHQESADFFGPQIMNPASPSPYYRFWKQPPQVGTTLTITKNSAAVTGQGGTTFTTTFPPPVDGDHLAYAWVKSINATGGDAWVQIAIIGVTDDTHLTLTTPWLQETLSSASCADCGQWNKFIETNGDPTNGSQWYTSTVQYNMFYGMDTHLYPLGIRTGLPIYTTYADEAARLNWERPTVASGLNYVNSFNQFPRNRNWPGQFIRAMRTNDTNWWTQARPYWLANSTNVTTPTQFSDMREAGYNLEAYAYCALFEPDPTQRANCGTYVNTSMTAQWEVRENPVTYGSYDTVWYTNQTEASFTGMFTNGSTTVTSSRALSSETCNTSTGDTAIWLWAASDPSNTYRCVSVPAEPSFTLTLDRPFNGPTSVDPVDIIYSNYPGPGSPIYMGAIASWGMDAVRQSGITRAAYAAASQIKLAAWQYVRGTVSSPPGGTQYAAEYGKCYASRSGGYAYSAVCGGTTDEVLSFGANTAGSIAKAYSLTGDVNYKTRFDSIVANNFGYPGGSYYHEIVYPAGGWYVQDRWQFFGEYFASGRITAGLAYTVGGHVADDTVAALVGYQGGGAATIYLTDPAGNTDAGTACAAAPCSVSVNASMGAWRYRLVRANGRVSNGLIGVSQ